MQGIRRIFSIVCVALILLFGLIHLGVSIGILGRFRHYGNVFRPERGLAAWNIVISILALATGIAGLFSVLTSRGNLSKVTAFASIVLSFFALISLITALIINSLAITYVTSRFTDHMNNYKTSQDSRTIIGRIQTNYDCCGTNTWLDWSRVQLNASATSATTTVAPAGTTTGGGGGATTTGSGGGGTTTGSGGGGTTTGSGGGGGGGGGGGDASTTGSGGGGGGGGDATTTVSGGGGGGGDSGTTISSGGGGNGSDTSSGSRKKRQATSDYGGIYGLPTTFVVTLPQSCCSNDPSSTDDTSPYCASTGNNATNSFHTNGCAKELGKRAVGQTLGLAVINSFLIVIALATMVALFETSPYDGSGRGGMINQAPAQYGHADANAAGYPPDTSYNNYNAGY